MVESYLLPGGMVQTDSRRRYDPSTIKLTSYLSLYGQRNPFSSGQLLGKFLCDIVMLSSSNTMRNPSLETKCRQRVWQYRISRHRLRKCLGSSGHSSGVMPLSLYGTYCWGHSPALTNNNNFFLNDAISMSVQVDGIWDTIPGSGFIMSAAIDKCYWFGRIFCQFLFFLLITPLKSDPHVGPSSIAGSIMHSTRTSVITISNDRVSCRPHLEEKLCTLLPL